MEISPSEAKHLIENSAAVCLVDCREPDEFAQCHIPGALLIPLSSFRTEAAAKLSDKEQTILVYCHHGMRSLKAAHYLFQLGYKDARSISGGIDLWSLQIDPSIPRY